MTYKGYASGYEDGYKTGQDDIQKEWKVVARGRLVREDGNIYLSPRSGVNKRI